MTHRFPHSQTPWRRARSAQARRRAIAGAPSFDVSRQGAGEFGPWDHRKPATGQAGPPPGRLQAEDGFREKGRAALQNVSVTATGAAAVTCARSVGAGSLPHCQGVHSMTTGATVSVCASSSMRCVVSAQDGRGSSILMSAL